MINSPRIVGHRGAKAITPENTLTAFRRARAEGASWVEFDAKLTRDNHVVIMHDATLERTTNGTGNVADRTLAELKTLDAGAWFAPEFAGERIPTLVEALALFVELDMGFNIEVKPCPGREEETARICCEVIDRHWPKTAPVPVLSSFKQASLAAARAASPHIPRGYLAEELGKCWRADVEALGCAAVHPGWKRLTRQQVRDIKEAGLKALVWTVNEPERARELLAWGVDSIITDMPPGMVAAV